MIKLISTTGTPTLGLEISPDLTDRCLLPGMVVHICNPDAQETEAGMYEIRLAWTIHRVSGQSVLVYISLIKTKQGS